MPGDAEARLVVTRLRAERDDRELFRELSFTLGAGALVHVQGPNGAGKTTLLRMLCGLLPADGGEIRWRGEPVGAPRPDYAAELGYLGHVNALKLELSAEENLQVAIALSGASADARAIQAALADAGLYGFEDVPVRQLSAGQRRRAALAGLRLRGARLWVLDEPVTSLDAAGREWFLGLIDAHLRDQGMVVLTTHQTLPLQAPGGVTHVTLEPNA